MKKQQRNAGIILSLPLIAGVLFSYTIPLFLAFWKSLFRGMGNRFIGFDNYIELLSNSVFLLALQNTVFFWLIGITLNLIVGFSIALLCAHLGNRWLQALSFFPAMVPAACVVAMVHLLLNESAFPLSFAYLFKVDLQGWISTADSVWVLIGLFLWKSCGYTVILLTAALSSIPKEVLEAACIDGAKPAYTVFRIQLPLIRSSFLLSGLITFVNSFKIFREAFLLGGTHPHPALYSIQHFLHNNFSNLNYARLAAASIFVVLFIAAISGIGAVLLPQSNKRGV